MKRLLRMIAMACALVLLAASCGDDDDATSPAETESTATEEVAAPAEEPSTTTGDEAPPEEPTSEPVKVGALLPCLISDLNFCQQGYAALAQLEEEGAIELDYLESAPIDEAAAEQAMRQYADNGAKLVVAHSSVYIEIARRIGPEYPETMFAVVGADAVEGNMSSYDPVLWEAAYLAGIISAYITESNVIGGVSAFDIPLCHAMMVSFEQGAQTVDPEVTELVAYVGDFVDPAPAKEAALTQNDGGADVFAICGSGPSEGAIPAAAERGVSAWGYVGDQSALAPDNVVGSMIWDMYPAMADMVARVQEGDYSGVQYPSGIADGTISLHLNPAYSVAEIPQEALDKVDEAIDAVKSGELVIEFVGE